MSTASGKKTTYNVYAYVEYTVTNSETTTTLTVSKAQVKTSTSNIGINGSKGTFSGTGQTTKTNNSWKMRNSATVNVFSSFSWSWNRGTSAATKAISFSITFDGHTSTASFNVTVPARTAYSIGYNGNGATSGSVGGQTKYYGYNINLQSNGYSRTGYTFINWNTASNGTGTAYSAGGVYSANSGATMYAQWRANTYNVTLSDNYEGGSTSSLTRTYAASFTIPSTAIPTRAHYNFLGWSASDTATVPTWTHAEITSGNCTISAYNNVVGAITLYAVWEQAYIEPSLSNLTAYRVETASSTTPDDAGLYVYCSVSYEAGYLDEYLESTVTILVDGVSAYSTNVSSQTGTVTVTVGTYSADESHALSVVIADSYGSASLEATIPTAIYPIDLYGSGTNVYMGIMRPYIQGIPLSLTDTYIDGDLTIYIDENATGSATVDGRIMDALRALGWDSDVIV